MFSVLFFPPLIGVFIGSRVIIAKNDCEGFFFCRDKRCLNRVRVKNGGGEGEAFLG